MTSTKAQIIAWSACCAGIVALIVLLVVGGLVTTADEDATAAVCCVVPVSAVGLAVWGLMLAQRWTEERQASKRGRANLIGRCPTCGYDTSGLKDCCPECGSPLTSAAWGTRNGTNHPPPSKLARYWTAQRQGIAWCLIVLLATALAILLTTLNEPAAPLDLFCCMLPFAAAAMLAWGIWIVWHWDDSSF
ncbi:MAG: hypothetical protein ACF8R9_09525 [Phycisphaerales bacterium JB054]